MPSSLGTVEQETREQRERKPKTGRQLASLLSHCLASSLVDRRTVALTTKVRLPLELVRRNQQAQPQQQV